MKKKQPNFFERWLAQRKKDKLEKRFTAANNDKRINANWLAQSGAADDFIARDVEELRNQSREAARNDTYAVRFLAEITANVIGKDGIKLVSKVPKMRGSGYNESACRKIEQAWADFSQRGNFDVTGQYSRPEFERLLMRSIARDGQVLARFVEGFPNNDTRFACQAFEAEALDVRFNDAKQRIKCGIQRDEWNAPTNYFLSRNPYRNYPTSTYSAGGGSDTHERIPAANMAHIFIQDRISQSAGVPWLAPALERLFQLRKFEEAALISARQQASNGTYFEQTADAGEFTGVSNVDGSFDVPTAPGEATILPNGYSVKVPTPSQPNDNYAEFRKNILRGVAAGLYVNYNVLASDLEGVSFSSIRSGTLSDRALWEIIQSWFIDEFEAPLFRKWLPLALMSGQLDLSPAERAGAHCVEFAGRSWPWVSPLQDVAAAEKAIALKIDSRQSIAGKAGRDFSKVVAENEADEAQLDAAGLSGDSDQSAIEGGTA